MCRHEFSVYVDKYQGMWLLDHMVRVYLVWGNMPSSLPKWLSHLAFPSAVSVSVVSHPYQYLLLPVFWILATLIGV
jgi:hypothetical protein